MNDINLLNGFYQPKRTIRVISVMVIVVIFVVFLSYFGVIVPLRDKHEMVLRVANFLQVNQEYENIEKEHAELSRRMEELKKKAENISPLTAALKWSEIFSQIEQVIPQGIALFRLSYDDGVLTIQGQAGGDIEIAQFMVKLESTGLFSTVKLKRIDGDGNGESFIMLCSFQMPQHSNESAVDEKGE